MTDGNDIKRVVGVRLDPEAAVPVVIVKGAGAVARWLLDEGEMNQTPVVRDAPLLEELYRTPIDAPVNRDLFPVMAVLLAHVLQIDQDSRETQS